MPRHRSPTARHRTGLASDASRRPLLGANHAFQVSKDLAVPHGLESARRVGLQPRRPRAGAPRRHGQSDTGDGRGPCLRRAPRTGCCLRGRPRPTRWPTAPHRRGRGRPTAGARVPGGASRRVQHTFVVERAGPEGGTPTVHRHRVRPTKPRGVLKQDLDQRLPQGGGVLGRQRCRFRRPKTVGTPCSERPKR